MQSWTKQIAIPIFVALLSMAAQSQKVTVAISLEKNSVTLHEPVILDIDVTNPYSLSTHLDLGYDESWLSVAVRDPDGQTLNKETARREGMRFSNAVDIAPGASRVVMVLLNDWFTFDKAGNYWIDLTAAFPSGSVLKGAQFNTRLILAVAARDEGKLRLTCADLVRRLRDSHTASEAILAARALASVNDVAAIPFLAEAIERREFAGMMINALARLGTSKATAALYQATQSADPEVRNLAESALRGLSPK